VLRTQCVAGNLPSTGGSKRGLAGFQYAPYENGSSGGFQACQLPSSRMALRSAGKRVIVTDDDVDAALSLAALLREELPRQVDVVVTHDGMEALEEASREPPPLAVVLDMNMPRLSGVETASAIRRSLPAAKDSVLIAVSGDQDLLDNAQRSGYFKMVQRKPIDFEKLLGLLNGL
jgi:CheY-like chemotaxis protein